MHVGHVRYVAAETNENVVYCIYYIRNNYISNSLIFNKVKTKHTFQVLIINKKLILAQLN